MNNFLKFIEEDIAIKKSNIESLPLKTKTNIKNASEAIESYNSKYYTYAANLRKYIELKSNSIEIVDKAHEEKLRAEELKKKVDRLQSFRKLINPYNTFYEKLEFDALFYDLSCYADFDFKYLNSIINNIYEKFTLINVNLGKEDFRVTTYVNEYMSAFLDARAMPNPTYVSVEPIFEKIYWVNPNIIDHIELQFRILIRRNKEKFENYVTTIQNDEARALEIFKYDDCISQLQAAHYELSMCRKETIEDVITLAENGEIDMADYFPDSKFSQAAYGTLVVNRESSKNIDNKEKLHTDLKKLKNVLIEYEKYVKFLPFVEYSKNIMKEFKPGKGFKEIHDELEDLGDQLNKVNRVLYGGEEVTEKKLFSFLKKEEEEPSVKPVKQLQADSVVIANKMLELYKLVDSIKFFEKVGSMVNEYVTLDDFLTVYYSYDFFKKKGLKNTFNPENYDALKELCKEFDDFSGNPNNVVITSVPIFSEYDVTKVIINKYRINNINLTEESLKPGNIELLQSYIKLFLRVTHIMECNLTVEKLWFKVETKKILKNKTSAPVPVQEQKAPAIKPVAEQTEVEEENIENEKTE